LVSFSSGQTEIVADEISEADKVSRKTPKVPLSLHIHQDEHRSPQQLDKPMQ
jgi:hypothetical protein